MENSPAYRNLETYDIGASLSGKIFSAIPADLVTEVTINSEVKVLRGPMRARNSISFVGEKDFVPNSHNLAELQKE